MDKITTVGLDLAKQVMAMHAAGADGRMVMRKVLRRDALLAWSAALAPCVMAMEACGGAHHWARELTRQGHTVRIIAAEFVRAFRKSGKNDANDAEAICTAVRQANMRFVAIKSVEQQAALCVHRLRQGLVEERTALINRLGGDNDLVRSKMIVVQQDILLDAVQPAARVAHRVRGGGAAVAGEATPRTGALPGSGGHPLAVGGAAARG